MAFFMNLELFIFFLLTLSFTTQERQTNVYILRAKYLIIKINWEKILTLQNKYAKHYHHD